MERNYEPMIKLKLKRVEKGLTQAQLAEKVGKAQNSISLYELGEHFPGRDTLDKLAEALECKIGDLI